MTLMEGDEMHRLWSLVVDLSAQLNMNRQNLASVQAQLEKLKAHSVHANTGFALRRFNVDVSKDKFESELERLNVHLIQENNDLRWENKMNDRLIKEYEQCLDIVMKKFRSFSHATQTHTLRLTQHYEDLLTSTSHNAASEALSSTTMLSESLSHLGHLVRSALREIEGEGPVSNDDERTQEDAEASRRFLGSGGYIGKAGDKAAQRADLALEREAELQSLRYENEALKEILGMSEGKGLDVGAGKDKLSLGLPRSIVGGVRRLKGTNLQEQLYPPMPPQNTDVSAIPSAPFPSASATSLGSSPTPPPPPSAQQRMPLHERMQQAADSIRSPSPLQQQGRSIGGSSPYIIKDMQSDAPASAESLSLNFASAWPSGSVDFSHATYSSVLMPTPPESASAQSDIRSAPLLPLAVTEASEAWEPGHQSSITFSSSSALNVSQSDGTASERISLDEDELAAEEAIDLTDEEGEPPPATGESADSGVEHQPSVTQEEEGGENDQQEPSSALSEASEPVPKDSMLLMDEGQRAAARADETQQEVQSFAHVPSPAPSEESPTSAQVTSPTEDGAAETLHTAGEPTEEFATVMAQDDGGATPAVGEDGSDEAVLEVS